MQTGFADKPWFHLRALVTDVVVSDQLDPMIFRHVAFDLAK